MLHARVVLPVLAGVVLLGAAVTTRDAPLSLATDVGYTDEQVCEALATHGRASVQRLEAERFPHATPEQREVYRLARGAEVQAVLLIDWESDTAQCLPLDHQGPISATFVMTPRAYGALVGEFRNVAQGGGLSGHAVGNWWAVVWGTDVDIPSKGDLASQSAYEWELATWSAGRLTSR